MRFIVWILLATCCAAAPTNWPVAPTVPAPNTVPKPPLPGINIPDPPLLPQPASPYLLPLTNAPVRPKAMAPPTGLPSGADMMRSILRHQPPPPTAISIAATQAVTYVEPLRPESPHTRTNQTWYVHTTGSDQNDGSPQKPWRTIQRAADAALPGDTVLVAPGYYEGFCTVRSGTPQKPVTFKAHGDVLILTNTNTPADHILVRDTNWITIEGFTCRNAPRAGIAVLDAIGVVLSNNTCAANGKWGIFTGFTPRIQILHNKCFRSREQHGIYVSNSRVPEDNPVLRGNECFGNGASGIQLNGDATMGGDGIIQGALIEANIVHDNDSKGLSLISIEHSRIQNNVIYNNGRDAGAGGIHLTDEPNCDKPSCHNVVANNTIMEPRIAPMRLSDGASKNIIFNNLIAGRRPIADEVHDNRIDTDTNLRNDMPIELFINPAAFDFRLTPNSRAARAGKAGYAEATAPTNDIQGVARSSLTPSIGAYDLAPTVPAAANP